MVELQINTTQNVNINFIAASVGERILAYVIDWVIKIAYFIVVYQIAFKLFSINELIMDMDNWSQMAIVVSLYLPVVFYSLIFETLLDGQTIGKRILRIKVVKIDGYQASLSDFVIRWIMRIVDLNMMTGVVALISIVVSKKSQRLGDMAAGTSVITLKNNISINHTILEHIEETYQPTYPSVIKLSDNDARIIKDTFQTAKKSGDYQTISKLRYKIIKVIDVKQTESSDVEFISTILKDYNYYTQNM